MGAKSGAKPRLAGDAPALRAVRLLRYRQLERHLNRAFVGLAALQIVSYALLYVALYFRSPHH